jgi:hypothetical protein
MAYKIFGKIISGSYHYMMVVYQHIWQEVVHYQTEKKDIDADNNAVMSEPTIKYVRYILKHIQKLESLKDKYVALMRVVLGIDADKGQFLPKEKINRTVIKTPKNFTTDTDENRADSVINHNDYKEYCENTDEHHAEMSEKDFLQKSILDTLAVMESRKNVFLKKFSHKHITQYFNTTFFASQVGECLKTEMDAVQNNVYNLGLYYNHEMHGLPLEISQEISLAGGRLKSDIQTRINHINYYVTALKECDTTYLNTQYANTASCFEADSYSDVTGSDFNFNDMPETVAAAIEKYVPYRLRAKIFDFSQPTDVITEKISQSVSELTQIMQRYFRELIFGFLEKNIYMMPHYKVNIACNHKFIQAFRGSG